MVTKKMATKKTTKKLNKFSNFKTPKFLLPLAVIVLFAGVGTYYLFSSRAAAPVTNAPAAPAVYLSPTSQSLGLNTTFVVELRENSGTTAVNVVENKLTYPVALYDYVSVDSSTSAFTIGAEQTIDPLAGTIKITRGASGGTSLTGDQLVAKITFKSKTTGGTGVIAFGAGTALYNALNSANLSPAFGNATYIVDTAAPATAITAPAANATLQLGSTSTITATATDAASDVTKVEFYVNNVLKSTDTASPYSYAWATTGLSEGAYSLTTKAYDTYNNVATSTAVSVNVKDTTAPTVSITAPAANATISGTTTVTATASDNTGGKGLAKVEFYINNVLKSTSTTAPYSYAWDSKTVVDGTYSLTAKAYDNATTPNVATSTSVGVTVDNADRTAPTAPANLRSTSNTLTSISLAWDASTDNVGVTGYRLTRNGTTIYTGTGLSYTDGNLANGTTYNYAVVALDAANNVSTATNLSTATKSQKPGDVNGDDSVGAVDLSILLTNWGTANALCDLNKDGSVGAVDLSILLTNWGK